MGPPEPMAPSTLTLVSWGCNTRTSCPSFYAVVMTVTEFLVAEFVKGENLREHLEGGPLPVLTAAEVVETLARAVHEAHRLGFHHGDLSAA